MKKPASGRIALGNAVVRVETDEVTCGFRIHTAWLEVLPTGKTPLHLHLEGKQGALTIQLAVKRGAAVSAGTQSIELSPPAEHPVVEGATADVEPIASLKCRMSHTNRLWVQLNGR